ncbi:hypothetical protein [Kitasatospora sp. NPDC088548]|uniref:hypothetical protein n=1 Tax=Kitasatospora sp. NPDC088548 TaxID=3364075 RepID=UPI0037FC07CB
MRDLRELWRDTALAGFETSVRARREADAAHAAVLRNAGNGERDLVLAQADKEARVARQITAGKLLDLRVAQVHRTRAAESAGTPADQQAA